MGNCSSSEKNNKIDIDTKNQKQVQELITFPTNNTSESGLAKNSNESAPKKQPGENEQMERNSPNGLELFKKSAEKHLIFRADPGESDLDDESNLSGPTTAAGSPNDEKSRRMNTSTSLSASTNSKSGKIVSLASLENLSGAEVNLRLQALSRGRIAVFDSGVGGLSVVRQLAHQLPYEGIVYFGDQARCPYGERSPAQICEFAKQIVEFLASQHDIKAVVIACNTASVHSLAALSQLLDIPVIGMIQPGALAVSCLAKPDEKVGVIATHATIQSKAYELGIAKLRWDLDVFTLETPKLAPLIENTDEYGEAEIAIIEQSLKPIKDANCKIVVSACTHYIMLGNILQDVLGHDTRIIDPAIAVVMKLKQVLSNAGLLRATPAAEQFGNDRYTFYTSGDPEKFQSVFNKWMKKDIRGFDQMQIKVHSWGPEEKEGEKKKNETVSCD